MIIMAYHIDKNNKSAVCSARPGHCPLGGQHYETKELADVAIQKKLNKEYGTLPNATLVRTPEEVVKAEEACEEAFHEILGQLEDTDVGKLGYGEAWEDIQSPTANDYMYPVLNALEYKDGEVVVGNVSYDYIGTVELNVRDMGYYSEPEGTEYDTTEAEDENLELIGEQAIDFIKEYDKTHPNQDYGEEHGLGLKGLVSVMSNL